MSSSVTVSEHLHTEMYTTVNFYPQAGMFKKPQWCLKPYSSEPYIYFVFPTHTYLSLIYKIRPNKVNKENQ